MKLEPIKVLVKLLLAELVLKPDQVTLANQRFSIPPDQRMYLNLSIMGTKDFATATRHVADPITNELVEVQTINRQEMISLLAYSSGSIARERSWEIPLAFTSTLAEQLMEQHSLKFAQLPSRMIDVSEQEGASRINAYSFTFLLLAAYEKAKPTEYFDKFTIPPIVTPNP